MARMKLLLDTNVVIDFLHERAVRDELYLQVVVGAIGEGAVVHEVAVDGARCALVVQQARQLAFLQYVEIDGGHGSLRLLRFGCVSLSAS